METNRIILRPWRDSDAEVLYKWASDPDVGPRAGWAPHKSVEESLEIIRTVFNDALHTWAIELKETGEPIGAMGYGPSCECDLPAREGEPLIGYWVAKPYWNKGICTEALRLMLDHIRETTDIKSLISGHFVDNPASGRVMEKCGFVPTGETCIDANQYQGEGRPIRVLRLELKTNMNKMMTLRPFNINDAETILSWCKDKHAFRLWSADRYKDFPAKPEEMMEQYEGENMYPLTAVVGEEIVGHILLRFPSEDKSVIRFGFVIVDDSKRGMGYGRRLLQLAIDHACNQMGVKTITLGVFADNPSALKCYQSVGFKITGEDSYMIDGEKWKGYEMKYVNYIQKVIECVKDSVLPIHEQIYRKCNGDFDRIFTEEYNTESYTGKVLESGKVYELSYLKCTCPMVQQGLIKNPEHCECSRQSILYILSQLEPKRKYDVQIIDTILKGAERCTFRITKN